MKGLNPAHFIKRFGGAHSKPNSKTMAQRYGIRTPGGRPPVPGMDYGQMPTQTSEGLNSSGRPSDASEPTPNTGPGNMGG